MSFDRIDIFSKVVSVIVLFTCLPLHEYAHAFVADKLGDTTARWEGRLTLNPLAHLDLFGSLALVFLGFGWAKPVPVNPRTFKNPKQGMALVAAAGPMANILIALVVMMVFKGLVLASHVLTPSVYFQTFMLILYLLIYINLYLAVFNLLPVPPLDGSRLFYSFLPQRAYFQVMKYERYIMIGIFVLLWMGWLSGPLHWLASGLAIGLDKATFFLGSFRLPY